MASIVTESTGRRRVFFEHAGQRKSISLGGWSMKQAEGFKLRLEALLISLGSGIADVDVEKWLMQMGDDLHAKLAAVDLVKPRAATTLGGWLAKHIEEKRAELKPASIKKLEQTKAKLLAFFDSGRILRTIDANEASEWRAKLMAGGSSVAYVKSTIGNAKTMMQAAVDRGLIHKNPFGHLEAGATAANAERYITPEEIEKILAACPNVRYKVVFALARYAGLRCPSETHLLTWADVYFDLGYMLVRSPKTERHAGHESRKVPIDPRLKEILLEAQGAALLEDAEGEQRVCTLVVGGQARKRFARIIEKAGVEAWAKLWQACRWSCEREWALTYPQYVVSRWIGHSITVSGKHYANAVPDELFAKAAGIEKKGEEGQEGQSEGESAACPSDRPVRQTERAGAKSGGMARNSKTAGAENPGDSAQFQTVQAEAEGFEPQRTSRNPMENRGVAGEAGAPAGAHSAGTAGNDKELAQVVEAWPKLPATIRAGVVAMVKAAAGQGVSR
jgi:integrase